MPWCDSSAPAKDGWYEQCSIFLSGSSSGVGGRTVKEPMGAASGGWASAVGESAELRCLPPGAVKAGREPFKRTKRINKEMLMLMASSIFYLFYLCLEDCLVKTLTTTAFNISIIWSYWLSWSVKMCISLHFVILIIWLTSFMRAR